MLIVYRDQGFAAVSIVTKRTNGSLVSPDAAPLCSVFRVNPTNGTLAKDLDVGTLGDIATTLVPGTSFTYSAAVDLSETEFEQYVFQFTYAYDASAGTNVEIVNVMISRPDAIIFRGRDVTVASAGTTYIAPTPEI